MSTYLTEINLPAIREQLASQRRAGQSFETAWAAVIDGCNRGNREVLMATVDAWRSAWDRVPEPGALARVHQRE
jgi:hypothetical protein